MSAFIADLEAEIDDVFFADLNVVGDFLAACFFAPAAFIQTELCIDKLAVILDQPVDAVVRSAAFFIGGEGDDDVTGGLEAFAFITN